MWCRYGKQSLSVPSIPNKRTRRIARQTFGCVRFVYNKMLEERIQMFEKFKDDQESLKQQTFPTPAKYKRSFLG